MGLDTLALCWLKTKLEGKIGILAAIWKLSHKFNSNSKIWILINQTNERKKNGANGITLKYTNNPKNTHLTIKNWSKCRNFYSDFWQTFIQTFSTSSEKGTNFNSNFSPDMQPGQHGCGSPSKDPDSEEDDEQRGGEHHLTGVGGGVTDRQSERHRPSQPCRV